MGVSVVSAASVADYAGLGHALRVLACTMLALRSRPDSREEYCLLSKVLQDTTPQPFVADPMLIDGRQLAPDITLRADICIIGTGMGALSAAHPLVCARRDVLFIEAGPLTASRRDPPAVRIDSVGRPFGI